jgi:Domain of unknown function (DUF4331)
MPASAPKARSTLTRPSSVIRGAVQNGSPNRIAEPCEYAATTPKEGEEMQRVTLAFLVVLGLAAAVTVALVRGSAPQAANASSHREAPLISQDPAADNTDLYAFVSPDRPDSVTIVANYVPLEQPAGGPNFATFGDDVRYELKVDNTGDGVEDVTYRFRFHTETRNKNTFLYNTGPIESLDDADWNRPQTYRVVRAGRNGNATLLGSGLLTPPANIGPRSTPHYEELAAAAVHDLPGGIKVFAGQRDDPFFVDLGSIFDLAGLRPLNSLHAIPLANEDGVDGVSGYNTHTIAIQVPITQLTRNHAVPTGPDDPNAVIGVYASASRRHIRILQPNGTPKSVSSWQQVSRLGEPLINEVVIPLGQKDRWNATEPEDDSQFVNRYLNPELVGIANALYPALDDAPTANRGDLVAVLLTGVPGLNNTGTTKADLLRLNVAIPPALTPDRMGVLAGDFAGFPNGRRLSDDVVDIELRALECSYGAAAGIVEGFGFCGGNAHRTPNNLITDGVDENERSFRTEFPYLATPFAGYEAVPPTPMGGP